MLLNRKPSILVKVVMLVSTLPLMLILSQKALGNEINGCIEESSLKYAVPKQLIELIAFGLEAGKPGAKNTNTNGSYDMGIMQINSIHLPEVNQFGIDEGALINDACTNIDVGTFLLAREIRRSNSFAKGLANYHSRTKKHAQKYLQRAVNIMEHEK